MEFLISSPNNLAMGPYHLIPYVVLPWEICWSHSDFLEITRLGKGKLYYLTFPSYLFASLKVLVTHTPGLHQKINSFLQLACPLILS